MAFPDRRTSNVFLTILLFALVLAVLYVARRVLLIFAFAILFTYLIDPVVRFLQAHSLFFKNLRGPHVVEAYLVFVIFAALAAQGLSPLVSTHADKLFSEAPLWLNSVTTGDVAIKIGNAQGWNELEELRLKSFLVDHREKIASLANSAEQFASNALVALVVVPILAVFFLADGRRITDEFIQLVSTEGNRQTISEAAEELNTMLRKYIRAKVVLGACSLVFYSAAMFSLGFPNAISLGLLGGVLEFVPVAGWMSSAAVISAVGILTHRHWIWMAVLLGVWRMALDYFISPRVVGRNLEIHPLMVLFAVMVGAECGGIVGIYLSIPLMVVIRVIWRRALSPEERLPLPSELPQATGNRSP
jgi:predicted PurR-regulated permease PerM